MKGVAQRITHIVDRLQGRRLSNPWARRLAEIASVTMFFAVLVALALAMKGYNPLTDHIGKGFADADWELEDWNSHFWAMWHVHKVYIGEATLSKTTWQFFPQGMFTANVFGNPLLLSLGGFLALVVSAQVVLVLVALLVLVGNGVGGYVLLRSLTGSGMAGLVAGLLFCFGGMAAWAVNTGNYEYGIWLWLCLYFAFLDRVLRFGTKADVVLGMLTGVLAILGNLAFVFAVAGISALLVLYRWRSLDRRRWISVAVLAMGCGLLLSPVVLVFDRGEKAEQTFPSGVPDNTGGGVESEMKVAYLNSYPAAEYLPWKRTRYREDADTWFVLWLLVLLSFSLAGERAAPWLIAGGVLFLVTLGPYAEIDPQMGSRGVPKLPFYYLHKYVPFFEYMHFPHRVLSLVMLALGVAAGIGVAAVLRRIGRTRPWAGPMIAAVVLVELLATWGIRYSERLPNLPFYEQLAKDTDDYALAVFPSDLGTLDARHLYYQTQHNKKLVNGAFPRYLPKKLPTWKLLNRNAIMRGAYVLQYEDLPESIRKMYVPLENTATDAQPDELEDARKELSRMGIGYVVFHRRLDLEKGVGFAFPQNSRIERFLRNALGQPDYADEYLLAWTVGRH